MTNQNTAIIVSEIPTVTKSTRMTNAQRRAYWRKRRIMKIRSVLYIFICWLQSIVPTVRTTVRRLPNKLARAAVQFCLIMIALVLLAAAFFAACGVLYMALKFWASCYGY